MKFTPILAIAIALSLTACSGSSTKGAPPSIRLQLPPLQGELDKEVEPLGQIPDGTMGTLVITSAQDTQRYGLLSARYNTLREFYNCVRERVNSGNTPDQCISAK